MKNCTMIIISYFNSVVERTCGYNVSKLIIIWSIIVEYNLYNIQK